MLMDWMWGKREDIKDGLQGFVPERRKDGVTVCRNDFRGAVWGVGGAIGSLVWDRSCFQIPVTH